MTEYSLNFKEGTIASIESRQTVFFTGYSLIGEGNNNYYETFQDGSKHLRSIGRRPTAFISVEAFAVTESSYKTWSSSSGTDFGNGLFPSGGSIPWLEIQLRKQGNTLVGLTTGAEIEAQLEAFERAVIDAKGVKEGQDLNGGKIAWAMASNIITALPLPGNVFKLFNDFFKDFKTGVSLTGLGGFNKIDHAAINKAKKSAKNAIMEKANRSQFGYRTYSYTGSGGNIGNYE